MFNMCKRLFWSVWNFIPLMFRTLWGITWFRLRDKNIKSLRPPPPDGVIVEQNKMPKKKASSKPPPPGPDKKRHAPQSPSLNSPVPNQRATGKDLAEDKEKHPPVPCPVNNVENDDDKDVKVIQGDPVILTPTNTNQAKKKKNKNKKQNKKKKQKLSPTTSPQQNNIVQAEVTTNLRPYPTSGKGIEGRNNSCYMDSTLFALFYYGDTFDGRLLEGNFSKPSRDEVSVQVTSNLERIVGHLRKSGYCPASLVEDLRRSMAHINRRLTHNMMDVDEFISNLFGKALHLLPMVQYYIAPGVETGNYLHQILISPVKHRPYLGRLDQLLEESMGMQRLKFGGLPNPALIIKMPRSNGKLIGHGAILPNLQIDLSKLIHEGSKNERSTKFDLRAVIVLHGLHYTVFVRCGNGSDSESPWHYFNDLPASIRTAPGITKGIANAETQLITKGYQDNNMTGDLHQIIHDIHVCIYVPNEDEDL